MEGMFRDKVQVHIKAGHGGGGKVSYDRDLRPTGGDGGKGGDVYLIGSESVYDLRGFRHQELYAAENGEHGKLNKATGASGKDLLLRVPIATVVYGDDGGKLAEVKVPGEQVLLLKGGRGGIGNHYFQTRGRENRHRTLPADPGEELRGRFELEIVSDVIFIGLPNAGKSSVLKELTNAKAKVAPYAFTTIDPQLGKTENGLIMLDLPGLIEGTAEGKGVGTSFVKHTRRTKVVAHFVSLETDDPVAVYDTMSAEIAAIDSGLAAKPQFIILTKADLVDSKTTALKLKELRKRVQVPAIAISAYDYDSLQTLANELKLYVDSLS